MPDASGRQVAREAMQAIAAHEAKKRREQQRWPDLS